MPLRVKSAFESRSVARKLVYFACPVPNSGCRAIDSRLRLSHQRRWKGGNDESAR